MAGIGGTSPLKGPKWLYLNLFDDFDDFDLFFGPFQARIFGDFTGTKFNL